MARSRLILISAISWLVFAPDLGAQRIVTVDVGVTPGGEMLPTVGVRVGRGWASAVDLEVAVRVVPEFLAFGAVGGPVDVQIGHAVELDKRLLLVPRIGGSFVGALGFGGMAVFGPGISAAVGLVALPRDGDRGYRVDLTYRRILDGPEGYVEVSVGLVWKR